uniref:C2H2 AKAP95-type domain-containing protein n=1 Tax=Esox lucius TaxID=8010 RepID=A0A3P8ZZI5_ESOLU
SFTSYVGGYSSWGGGGGGGSGSRGSGSYDLYGGGYKDSMSGLGGYGGGYGGGGGQMKRGLSLSSTGTSADAVIAKINQRLDMLTQLEGGVKGGSRSDRFDQYESFDSRGSSSLPSRDLYRSSSYGYGDGRGDGMTQRASGFGGGAGGGSGFDSSSSYVASKFQRQNMRDSFSSGLGGGGGGGWAGAGRRSDPTPMGGGGRGGGHSPGGRGKLPSLLGHRMYPETGPQDFPGRNFGGGPRAGRQRGRKRPLNRVSQRDGQKKRKQTVTAADEPESKMNKTETAGGETAKGTALVTMEEEISQVKRKLQTGKQTPPQDKTSKVRRRRGFLENSGVKLNPRGRTQRVTFACSVCKFRSFYHEDMAAHLESKFHKEHFKFLTSQLFKPTTDFLQEYLNNKYKKTEQRTSQMENHSAAICQVYKEQDLTRELGMEHFMRKVEAAHCAACDLFIPMQFHLIQKHLKSNDHNFKRKGMMEQSKRASLSVARSILNHKVISKKLESYLKGENPFLGNQDDQDPDDSMMEVSEAEVTNDNLAEAETSKEEAEPEADQAVAGPDGAEEKMEEGGAVLADRGEGETQEGEVDIVLTLNVILCFYFL